MRAKCSFFCLASCILFSVGKAADFTNGSPATIPFTKQYDFTSKINGLGYRVWISSPAKVDPTRAYPIIYGLDGNSIAGMAFWRQDEARVEPVVQVFIGYPTEDFGEPRRRRFLDLTFSEFKRYFLVFDVATEQVRGES